MVSLSTQNLVQIFNEYKVKSKSKKMRFSPVENSLSLMEVVFANSELRRAVTYRNVDFWNTIVILKKLNGCPDENYITQLCNLVFYNFFVTDTTPLLKKFAFYLT